jgi:hypothetical protein
MRKGRPKVAFAIGRGAGAAGADDLGVRPGKDSTVVAHRLHMTPRTVCKWRGRFTVDRLEGLYDEPRSGAKRSITDAQVEDVIIRTLETTPRGTTHWSTRGMAKAVGLSHTAIRRIGRGLNSFPSVKMLPGVYSVPRYPCANSCASSFLIRSHPSQS